MVEFKELSIGDRFFLNGNHYTKKSSRTAYINEIFRTDRIDPFGSWFYFGQKETVKRIV